MILLIACLFAGLAARPAGPARGAAGLRPRLGAGPGLALIFSVANVFFRDFSKVVQTLNQFVTFSVPMMYPYTMVWTGSGAGRGLYLYNPMAEAVLLIQRCFWTGTTAEREATVAMHHARPTCGRAAW